MSDQWRLLLAALRFVARGPRGCGDLAEETTPHAAMRFVPLAGMLLGAIGGGAYWLAAQVWPTSIAVVLALFVVMLVSRDEQAGAPPRSGGTSERTGGRTGHVGGLYRVFVLLIKYDALMGLSAARLPSPVPADVVLGLIMVGGQGASRALAVSVMATDSSAAPRVTAKDLTIALILGSLPATLLGIPGLIGLAAAILVRLGLTAHVLPRPVFGDRERLNVAQQLTEGAFYLGALATWKYV